MEEKKTFRYRSLFWPILLIAVGIIWLLSNLEMLPAVHWSNLWRFWPMILIVIGLDVIFARRAPFLGALLGIAVVALAIVLLLLAPSLGIVSNPDIVTNPFSAPIENAKSARVEIDVSVGPITIEPLSDSNQLVEAEITHIGEIDFSATGGEEKLIIIKQDEGSVTAIHQWPDEELKWDVRLNPSIPIFLELQGGVGEAAINLSQFQLKGVDIDLDVGELDLTLPAMDESYPVTINGGVGDVQIYITEGASLNLDLEGDVGDFIIDIPDDAFVRLDAKTNVGDIRLPSSFHRVSGDEDQIVGESGVWETSGYEDATHQIMIEFSGDVGALTIR